MKFCVFQTLKEFRDDELHHHDIGLENDAEKVNTLRSQVAKLELSKGSDYSPATVLSEEKDKLVPEN